METDVSRQSATGNRQLNSDCQLPDAECRIVEIARSWIGTPYVHQASLKGVGCDCLGLLRGIWRELYGEEPEPTPPYSLDWAEATGVETLYMALGRHAREIGPMQLAPGDIALFRMLPRGPAKHCGIIAERDGAPSLIHSRQNKRVSEEPLSLFWRNKLAFAFRL
jgi:NlpC/P60 family putative phage cell wall peptidase